MQVNKLAEIHGLILDPLKVDTLAKNIHPIVDISVSNLLLSANLKMWDIQMHGLSTIYTNNILVTRAKNLFDIDFEVEVKFSRFYLNGTYNNPVDNLPSIEIQSVIQPAKPAPAVLTAGPCVLTAKSPVPPHV